MTNNEAKRWRMILACLAALTPLACFAADGTAPAKNPAALVDPVPHLQDNLSVRAAFAGEKFRVEKEGVCQVYLHSTLPLPLTDVKLKVDSDQFEAAVAPSPTWKTYPELPAGAEGGAKGCFSVSLRRKAGSPGAEPDVYLRLYASCGENRFLAAALTLAEALDEHRVPWNPSLKIDGQPSAQFWGNALVLKDFMACQKLDEYLVGYKYTRAGSTNLSRIYLAADDENLNLLVATVGYNWFSPGTQMKILIAPERDQRPVILAADELTFQLTCSPAVEGAKCVRCKPAPGITAGGCDVVIYQVGIPRKAVGINKDYFYMNFSRIVTLRDGHGSDAVVPGLRKPESPEVSCWRGNERSADDPAVFGKMILQPRKTEGK